MKKIYFLLISFISVSFLNLSFAETESTQFFIGRPNLHVGLGLSATSTGGGFIDEFISFLDLGDSIGLSLPIHKHLSIETNFINLHDKEHTPNTHTHVRTFDLGLRAHVSPFTYLDLFAGVGAAYMTRHVEYNQQQKTNFSDNAIRPEIEIGLITHYKRISVSLSVKDIVPQRYPDRILDNKAHAGLYIPLEIGYQF